MSLVITVQVIADGLQCESKTTTQPATIQLPLARKQEQSKVGLMRWVSTEAQFFQDSRMDGHLKMLCSCPDIRLAPTPRGIVTLLVTLLRKSVRKNRRARTRLNILPVSSLTAHVFMRRSSETKSRLSLDIPERSGANVFAVLRHLHVEWMSGLFEDGITAIFSNLLESILLKSRDDLLRWRDEFLIMRQRDHLPCFQV